MAKRSSKTDSPPTLGAAPPRPRAVRWGQVAAVLAVLGFAGWMAWLRTAEWVRGLPQYRVTATCVVLSPVPPPWVHSDLRTDALRQAGLEGGLSILDPPERLQQRVADALHFHPWVRSVRRVTKAPPNRLLVELEYRRPVAAVRWSEQGGPALLLLVDSEGYRLPEGDLPEEQCRRLPRLLATGHKPLVGERWNDPKVAGAVSMILSFGENWDRLSLTEVVPHPTLEVRGEATWPVFSLLTVGASRVVWGAAPGFGPPDEPPFQDKLDRLLRHVAEHGSLASIQSHEVIDVRYTLSSTPRSVKHEGEAEGEVVR